MAHTGPSELEINKERLLVTQDEYRRLNFVLKKHELDRNSRNARLQQELRKQWDLISKLNKKKSELLLKNRLQDTESLSSKGATTNNNFDLALNKLSHLEDQVNSQKEKLDKTKQELALTEKKLRRKQKEIVKVHRSQDRILQHQRTLSHIQNRLSGCLARYSQLLVSNRIMRDDISSTLLTQRKFRKKYTYIKKLLALGSRTVTEVVHTSTVAYQTRETAKYKVNVIKERTQVDRTKLLEKIKELQYMLERDKQLSDFIELKDKERPGIKKREELTAKTEQEFEQKMTSYENTMTRIQAASSLKDVNHMCKNFTLQEETNLTLFNKVNELNLEIERLHESVRAQRQELESTSRQYKEQKRKDIALRSDFQKETENLRDKARSLEISADKYGYGMEEVKRIVERICDLIDKALGVTDAATNFEERITDDNILHYLEVYERKIIDLIHCLKFIAFKGYDSKKVFSMTTKTKRKSKTGRLSPATDSISFHKSDSGKFTINPYEDDSDAQTISYNRGNLDVYAKRSKDRRPSSTLQVSR